MPAASSSFRSFSVPVLSAADAASRRAASGRGPEALAMYASDIDAIVTEPHGMHIRVDDHLVHRGDGVFETLRAYNGKLYLLKQHLARLERSAEALDIALNLSPPQIEARLNATLAAGGDSQALLRILLGRGPGGFGVSPQDAKDASLTIVAYPCPPSFMQRNPAGARVILSRIPVKPSRLAQIKTCNYIPNALMKKEALEAGADFAVGVDPNGMVTESFTENLCRIDENGTLIRPDAEFILCGTTMMRIFELAEAEGIPTRSESFSPAQAADSPELLIFGTTSEVTAVVEFNGTRIGDGTPGALFKTLSDLLQQDIASLPRIP